LLVALGAAVAFWLDTLKVRELAIITARDVCSRQNLQLLDGAVAVHRLSLGRSSSGSLVLRRVFLFTYSPDGVERRSGFIIMHGSNVEHVGL
jgi:hypothetical protein